MSTYQAHISKFTSDIVVNGKNQIDVNITFTDKKSGEYENEVYIELGKRYFYKYLKATSPQTVSFAIPVDWLSEIPDSSKGTGKIKLQCINSNTAKTEYEEIKYFTVFVPEEYKPEISNLSIYITDTNYKMVDYLVYGLTKPVAMALVTPHSTSPIKKWSLTGGGVTASGEEISYVSGDDYNFSVVGKLVRALSNTNFTLTVEDARKRTASITSEAFYVQDYNRPIVNSLSAYRTDKDGIIKADGGYIKVNVNAAASPIKNGEEVNINTLECYLSWKEDNGSDNYNSEEIINKEPFIFEADNELNYKIECTIRDKYMSTTAYVNVTGENKDFNIADGGGGAAIGTKAVKGYFDVAHNSRFQKGLSANEEISSKKGIVSTGTDSRGDFLSFGKTPRIQTLWHYVGLDPKNGAVLDELADFNDYTDIGVYGVYDNYDVMSSLPYQVKNVPCEKAGTLRVYNSTGEEDSDSTERHLIQEYVLYDGSAVYRRHLSSVRESSDVEWPGLTFGSWQCYPAQADYIVEQGTSNGWTYEKWNSGKLILYALVTIDTYGDSRHLKKYLNLPINTSDNPIVNVTMKNGIEFAFRQGAVVSYSYSSSNKTLTLILLKDNGGITNGDTVDVSVDIKGKWK